MRRAFLVALWLAAFPACSRDADLPEGYRRLKVPPGLLDAPAARERGLDLYRAYCVLCHGEKGDGRGVRREGLSKSPRDLTDSEWRRRTTPRHVYFAIREGVHGTPMAGWKGFTDDETWDLVACVLSLGDRGREAGASH
ncbi:MAG TPA: c-type cytochrome [Thermoanaerobaculia bacterium]|nr:c-type cytochrome [Thermoanaerobaculia bacterium]